MKKVVFLMCVCFSVGFAKSIDYNSTVGQCANAVNFSFIMIPTNAFTVADDYFTAAYPSTTVTTASVINNDQYSSNCFMETPNNGIVASLNGNIINLTINQTGLNGNFYINNMGYISVTAMNTIPPGSYPFSYNICDFNNHTMCSTANGWIFVTADSSKMSNTISTEVNINSVIIFPNPTNNILNISFLNQVDTIKIDVYNMLGQKLIERCDAQTNSTFIDLSNLPTSNYLLKISHGNEVEDKLIIKN